MKCFGRPYFIVENSLGVPISWICGVYYVVEEFAVCEPGVEDREDKDGVKMCETGDITRQSRGSMMRHGAFTIQALRTETKQPVCGAALLCQLPSLDRLSHTHTHTQNGSERCGTTNQFVVCPFTQERANYRHRAFLLASFFLGLALDSPMRSAAS
jgi:hypothetical protein